MPLRAFAGQIALSPSCVRESPLLAGKPISVRKQPKHKTEQHPRYRCAEKAGSNAPDQPVQALQLQLATTKIVYSRALNLTHAYCSYSCHVCCFDSTAVHHELAHIKDRLRSSTAFAPQRFASRPGSHILSRVGHGVRKTNGRYKLCVTRKVPSRALASSGSAILSDRLSCVTVSSDCPRASSASV